MSVEKPRDKTFIYGTTIQSIRVNKILKFDDDDFKRLKSKIVKFVKGSDSDDIILKTNKECQIDLIDLYDVDEGEEPIKIELIKDSVNKRSLSDSNQEVNWTSELDAKLDAKIADFSKKLKSCVNVDDSTSLFMLNHGKLSYDNLFNYYVKTQRVTFETPNHGLTKVMELKSNYKTEINLEEEKKEWKAKKNPNEIREQHPFFEEIMKKLNLTEGIFALRHEQILKESGRKPDYIFIKRSGPHKINLFYASFVVELMVKTLDYDHMGKTVLYNEEVLLSNPCRQFIISVLTNLLDMVLIKSEVFQLNGQSIIMHRISQNINFWTVGYKYIIQMYNSPETTGYDEKNNFQIMLSSGYVDEPIKYQLYKSLGKGLTARVFSLIASDDVEERHDLVVKIFEREDYFINEQVIMDKIAQRFQTELSEDEKDNVGKLRELNDGTIMYKLGILPVNFIQRVAANTHHLAIVYTPRGEPLENQSITQKQFEQMFECLRSMFNKGIIHRDLTPHHFLVTKDKRIFVIDFGSAILISDDELNDSNLGKELESSDPAYQNNYRGSIRFAATKILKCLIENKNYKPTRRHDMESFIKLFYFLTLKRTDFGNEENDIDRIKSSLKYWEEIEPQLSQFWKDAYKISRTSSTFLKNPLDQLYDHLKEYPNFYVNVSK